MIDLATHGIYFFKGIDFLNGCHYSTRSITAKNGMTIENWIVTFQMVAIHKTLLKIFINQSKSSNSKSKYAI